MILRRMIEHVKAQNWTAVGLDFVIVVLGVFMGIQLGNWNDGRAARALGQDYTTRLIADLQRDLGTTRNIVAYYDAVLDSIVETDHLLDEEEFDARQLVIAAYRASEFASTPPNRATWDQIVSSGHLGSLPDRVIDAGISEYYTFIEPNLDSENLLQVSPYRQSARSIIPLDIQIAIRDGCSDVMNDFGVIIGFEPDCELAVEPSALETAAEALHAAPGLESLLRFQYSQVALVRNNNLGSLVLIERGLSALGEPILE